MSQSSRKPSDRRTFRIEKKRKRKKYVFFKHKQVSTNIVEIKITCKAQLIYEFNSRLTGFHYNVTNFYSHPRKSKLDILKLEYIYI